MRRGLSVLGTAGTIAGLAMFGLGASRRGDGRDAVCHADRHWNCSVRQRGAMLAADCRQPGQHGQQR